MIELPILIKSTANLREHWTQRAARAKGQRAAAHMFLRRCKKPALPCIVTLVRVAPRELDTDNLAGGFKSVRDGIADWLGIKDNDPKVTWLYGQAKGEPKQYLVRIRFD